MTYERLAVLSAASVYNGSPICNVKVIWSGAVNNVQFDVMRHEQLHCVIVAFAGTNELKDWWRHTIVARDQLPYRQGLVHKGWAADWQMVLPTVQGAMTEALHHNDTLLFCGHSYGGALTQLAALHYAQLLPDADVKLYTFGCPRVGDKRYAKTINGLISHHYRYTVNGDPVPHLPFGIRYKHAGIHCQLPYRPLAHQVKNYLEALS